MIARSPRSESTARVSSGELSAADHDLMKRVASGDEAALGGMVDRWGDRLYQFTDTLRMNTREADEAIEETLRRLAFEASRFVARPEKFRAWIQRTFQDCAGAVVARRSTSTGNRTARSNPRSATIERRSATAVVFQKLLKQGRMGDALGYLNSQTPFRFTAVYRFDGLMLANLYLFDRQTGLGRDSAVAKVSDTYCLWINETLSVVQMSDSLTDPRAESHAKREMVRSYCGAPILDQAGDLFGTICHFDFEPRGNSVETLPVLAEVGPMLALQIRSIANGEFH